MANPVQSSGGHATPLTNFTPSFAIGAGHRIVIFIFLHNATPTAPTCSGCTFYQNGSTQTDAGSNTYTVWSGVPASSFSGAITFNGVSGNYGSYVFEEIVDGGATGSTSAGVRTSAGSFGNGTAVTSTATGAVTAGDYLFGGFGQDGSETTTTAGGNLTGNDIVNNDTGGGCTVGGSNNNTTAAAQTASWTTNNAQRWGAIAIVYSGGTAAAVDPNPIRYGYGAN